MIYLGLFFLAPIILALLVRFTKKISVSIFVLLCANILVLSFIEIPTEVSRTTKILFAISVSIFWFHFLNMIKTSRRIKLLLDVFNGYSVILSQEKEIERRRGKLADLRDSVWFVPTGVVLIGVYKLFKNLYHD